MRKIRAAAVAAVLMISAGVLVAAATPAYADDLGYPWANATLNRSGTYEWGYDPCPSDDSGCKLNNWFKFTQDGNTYGEADPWHYYLRNCTSYVAWKLASLGVPANKVMGLGNGGSWAANASTKDLTVGTTPQVGAVAVWEAGTAGNAYGHVAYVEAVHSDGTITVSDYNWSLDGTGGRRTVVPSANHFTKYVYFAGLMTNTTAATPSSAPPDSDGDGVLDQNDACPLVYVANNTGCPAKSDFSLDGKSEVASFYDYGGGATNLWLWNGQANYHTSGPYAPWSQGSGFEANRLTPAGNADFNGDKMQDTAAFYAYDNGALALDVWYGNPRAGLSPYTAWYVGSAWEGARVIAAGAGDFNGDGKADVAAFYRYDNNVVNLYVWYGQANLSLTGPYTVWTGNGWDGTRIITVGVGDTDGDGKADISTFYRHDNGMMDQNVWYGNGSGGFTLGRPWHVDTSWEGARFIPGGVADLNSDGKADTVAWYRQDNMQVDMRVWYGTSSRVGATDPGGPWSGFNGWDGTRFIPAGTGDYNGDGKMDVASFYRYDGQVVGLNTWYGDGAGNLSLFQGWYDNASGWEGGRMIPAAKG